MQNNVQIFDSKDFGKVRVVMINEQPWWALKDVCSVLGIRNHKMTAQRLDEDEVSLADLTDNLGRTQKTTIVSESGLYAVILRSDKPNAKDFRKWVTSEILPSIRLHGVYIHDELYQRMRESESFAEELLERLVKEKEKSGILAAFASQAAPKVRYHDIILQCHNPVQVTIIARDYGMSCIKFNKLLHCLGIQFRMGNTWILYSKYAGNGYTVTKTYITDGNIARVHTLFTQRGRRFLYDFLTGYGILPQSEIIGAGS